MEDQKNLERQITEEIGCQLKEHFLRKCQDLTEKDLMELQEMVASDLWSYIQTGIHEIINVYMDSQPILEKEASLI